MTEIFSLEHAYDVFGNSKDAQRETASQQNESKRWEKEPEHKLKDHLIRASCGLDERELNEN
jgi:hypothetical protein